MSPLYTLAPVALPSDRIAWLLKFYFNRICHEAFRDPAADPLFGPGWRRMYRLIQRLTRLALKWQRGTLPTPRAPRAPRAQAVPRPRVGQLPCTPTFSGSTRTITRCSPGWR